MRIILFLLIATVALYACSGKSQQRKQVAGSDKIPVKLIAIASDTTTASISASGLVATEDEARLSFKVGGIVESVLVKEGDRVSRGQLLATIKPIEIAAQVQQAELALQKAERDYQRASNLYKDSVATLEQLQNSKTGVDIARQQVQQVQFNQQYARIYAPADGFIIRRIGNPGELASPGAPVVVMNVVSGASNWILQLGLSDKEWAAVEAGNKATVTIDAFPGKTFMATVSKKLLAADPVSGSFPVELRINFNGVQPAVGMFGTANITASHSAVGHSIPYEALLEADGKNGFVFVTDDQKTVKRVAVTISTITNNRAYISEGLQGHAFIVSAGSPYLTDGSAIVVKE
jgi:membrane fusion protein, multidrug efflux system